MNGDVRDERGLDAIQDRYEDRLREAGADAAPEFDDLLPEAGSTDRIAALTALVALRMDHERRRMPRERRERGEAPDAGPGPTPLGEWLARYPELGGSGEEAASARRELALEEFRLRRQAGESVSPAEYEPLGVDLEGWPELDTHLRREWGLEGDSDRGPGSGSDSDSERDSAASNRTIRDLEEAARRYRRRLREGFRDGEGECDDSAAMFRSLHQDDPTFAEELAEGLAELPRAGDRFLDFQLLEELGRGAFGRVFLADQGRLAGRKVVLKIVPAAMDRGEAETLARLRHTNIMPIHSSHLKGRLRGICMPYLGRFTLDDVIRTRKGSPRRGRPTVPAGLAKRFDSLTAQLRTGLELAKGLAYAHRRNVIHGDLKPGNILVDRGGRPLLLDFNLARHLKRRAGLAVDRIGGTIPYMAPEQLAAIHGEDRPEPDPRADIYALGIILHELFTLEAPFETPRGPLEVAAPRMVEERRRRTVSPRRLNPRIPPAVEAILRKCLAFDPEDRYASARDLAVDLSRQLRHRPLRHAGNPSPVERMKKYLTRYPFRTLGAAAALSLAAGLAARWGVDRDNGPTPAARALAEQAEALADRLYLDLALWRGTPAGGLLGAPERLDNPLDALRRIAQGLDEEGGRSAARGAAEPLAHSYALAALEAYLSAYRGATRGEREREGDWWGGDPEAFGRALYLNRQAMALAGDGKAPGDWLERQARWGAALRAGATASAFEGTDLEDPRNLFWKALELTALGQPELARPLANRAARELGTDARAWYLAGLCRAIRRGEAGARDALGAFDRALEARPGWGPALEARGVARLWAGDAGGAASDFDEALREDSESWWARANRGLAHCFLGRHRLAIDDLLEAWTLGQDMDRPVWRVGLALSDCHAALGELERAREWRNSASAALDAGLERERRGWHGPSAADLNAMAFRREGLEAGRAIRDLELAVAREPDHAASRANLAWLAARRLRDEARASRLLEEGLTRRPGDETLSAARRRLRGAAPVAGGGGGEVEDLDGDGRLSLGEEWGLTDSMREPLRIWRARGAGRPAEGEMGE